jgi:hypothetical protein
MADTICLSGMITTINDSTNGFRSVLLRNAVDDHSSSSQSLRQTILALSATHLHGSNIGVKYKLKAIQLLSQSLQNGDTDVSSQFAACMMLCVCDVGAYHL